MTWVGLAWMAGCVTETGNPDMNLQISAMARTSDPSRVVVGEGSSGGNGARVTEAFVTMREIRFERAEDCDSGGTDEGEIEGPWTVDLVAVDSLPLTLPDAGYCRVRLRLDRAEGGEYDDRSIVLHGRRGDGVPFTVESRDNPDLEIRSQGEPFRIDIDGAGVLLAFDASAWLADMDLDGIDPSGGEIVVDDDHERSALDAFEEALEGSLDLFQDLDGDHDIDEGSSPLAVGG